ncbi:MAG: AAA family ATPase [Telmatospirillum sp.]|nr:AAA family ATPase [Telmatospirillum sp.]
MINHPYNDKPITDPDEDRFGVNSFASALAQSIRSLATPEGSVIALNGPWGSGKSSAVNLIRHHLKKTADRDRIDVVNFECWWFRGEDALALAFFREIYAALNPSLGERTKKIIPKLGSRLLRAGSVVGPAVDLAGGAGAGTIAAGAMEWLSAMIEQDESVEKLHAELSKKLAELDRRFLIIIDDIDRLSPEEALLVFRLVKSIGRLPNVIYLLVYDRELAERIVAERFPAEGAHYLEKIVQAVFELPGPDHADLCSQLLNHVQAIFGDAEFQRDIFDFMNIFYDVVAPELQRPRDIPRIVNALSVTWPPIAGEVYAADLMALETLRVLQPSFYMAIRNNGDLIHGAKKTDTRGSQQERSNEYDRRLLGSFGEHERQRYRRALMRLFPQLQGIWSNNSHSSSFYDNWSRQRRACSKEHFGTYFRLAVGENAIPKKEIDELISRADDSDFVSAILRAGLEKKRRNGSTRASALLEQLNVYATEIDQAKIPSFLAVLFSIADDLDVTSDEGKAFEFVDNSIRIHWLIRRLTLERLRLDVRAEVFKRACEKAALGWLIDFSESAYADYHPRDGREPEREERCLVTKSIADELRHTASDRIALAAADGTLAAHRKLPSLLFSWHRLSGDNTAVRAWTDRQLEDDAMVARLASAFTSHSWSSSAGFAGLSDRVARRNIRAVVQGLEEIIDTERFRDRVELLATADHVRIEDKEALITFLDAWRKQEDGRER